MSYGLDIVECSKLPDEMAVSSRFKKPKIWSQKKMRGIDWLLVLDKELQTSHYESLSHVATSFNRHTHVNVTSVFLDETGTAIV